MLAVPMPNRREMKPNRRHFSLFLACQLLLVTGFAGAGAEAQDPASAKAKLAQIRGRISALTQRMGDELKHRDGESARLREVDLAITAHRRRVEELRSARLAVERQRAMQRSEAARLRAALDRERAALDAQLLAAYEVGPQEGLRLLLSQSDAETAGRMMVYEGYVARARSLRIADIDSKLGRLKELLAQIDETTARLKNLQDDAAREMSELARSRGEHVAALAVVSRRVDSAGEELKTLRAQEQTEEALLADLSQVLKDFPVEGHQSFESLRGRLNWPVAGRIARRAAPDPHRNGILIEAARGAQVRAPYSGRVIFADWLQGMGLVLIIGHSGSYMTLYGRAEVLYKSVGDTVSPGEVIAGMGDSGAAPPRLYFEIRQGRTALDPRQWLNPRP